MKTLWLWPAVLGALTAAGLVIGLVFDGIGDVAAWIGLGAPVAVAAWFSLRR